jgi:hypothetical protein
MMQTTTIPMQAVKRRPHWSTMLGLLLVLLGAIWMAVNFWMSYIPSNLDLSTSKLTANGRFTVSYEPLAPISINKLQQWSVHVTDEQGQVVQDAQIEVDGDMPQHGHGLPTQPQVTVRDQDYLIEGLKFHMNGWWVVDLTITHDQVSDTVRFNLVLE